MTSALYYHCRGLRGIRNIALYLQCVVHSEASWSMACVLCIQMHGVWHVRSFSHRRLRLCMYTDASRDPESYITVRSVHSMSVCWVLGPRNALTVLRHFEVSLLYGSSGLFVLTRHWKA